jgi:hypothetical protein
VCRQKLTEHGISDKAVMLIDDEKGKVSKLYGGYPNSVFIIDRSGRIAWKAAWMNVDAVDSTLEALLNKEKSEG